MLCSLYIIYHCEANENMGNQPVLLFFIPETSPGNVGQLELLTLIHISAFLDPTLNGPKPLICGALNFLFVPVLYTVISGN